MILQKTILATAALLVLFSAPTLAADDTPETVGTIDQNSPSWGEDINLQGKVDSNGNVQGSATVGPQQNQVRFPKLDELKTNISESLPNLLPNDLLEKVKLPDDKSLQGKIFHPVCKVYKDGQEIAVNGGSPSRGSTLVNTPADWPSLLALTRIGQTTGVPNKSSGVQFQVSQQTLDDSANTPGNCDNPSGDTEGDITTTVSSGQTQIQFNLLTSVVDFFKGLIGQITPGQNVNVVVRPKSLIPGEAEFAKQTSGEQGFLRSFCPDELCPKLINEQETTPYVGADTNQKKIEYQGVAGARKEFDILQASLYPEGIGPARRLPSGLSLPTTGGQGIFRLTGNPNSTQLETTIDQAASAFRIPPAVLAAVAWVEGSHMWGYSNAEINGYSAGGAQDPLNCSPNGCTARGPMQFLNGGIATSCGDYTGAQMPDTWSHYADAVNESLGQSRVPNVCNIQDSIFGAAKLLKAASGTDQNTAQWNQDQVFQAIRAYYGACGSASDRLGGRTYCEFVWDNAK